MKKYVFLLLLVTLFIFGCKPEILPLPHSVPTPSNLSASKSNSGNGVSISWSSNNSSFGYVLYRATVNGSFSVISSGSGGTYSYTDDSVDENTIYRYKVAYTTESGFEGASCAEILYIPVVSGLSSVTKGSTVELSWNIVAGATSYSVYSTTYETYSNYFNLRGEVYTNSFTISNPSTASPLYYSIKANYSGDESDYSPRINGQHGVLPAPVISISSNTYKENTLQWTRVEDAASYVLYRVASGSSYVESQSGITDSQYIWTDLENVASYSYSVASVSASGTVGPKSDSIEVTLVDVPEISGVNYALNADGTSCDISWSALSDTELYPVVKVTYDTNSSTTYGEKTNYYPLAQNATSYTVPFSYSDAEYTVSVHAAYNGRRSAGAAPAEYYSLPKPALSCSLDATGIRITWNSNYQFWKDNGTVSLFRSNDVDSEIKEIPLFDPRSGEIIDTDTEPAVAYTYYLRHSLGGYNADSALKEFRYDGIVSWNNSYTTGYGIKVNLKDITLSWYDYAIAEVYQVYRSDSEFGIYSMVKETSELTYTDANLPLGTSYYYKIKSKFASFISDFSIVKSTTTWGAKPKKQTASKYSYNDYISVSITNYSDDDYARVECRYDADADGDMTGPNDKIFFVTQSDGSEKFEYSYCRYYPNGNSGNYSFRQYRYKIVDGVTYEGVEAGDWSDWVTVN